MSDYSALDRLLHRLALGNQTIMELCFELEGMVVRPSVIPNPAVLVTGLARSGTTALVRALHRSGEFSSLTYDDMPFLLAPNLWSKLVKLSRKKRTKKQRAHGDGIMVDFDSPEAFEEVFWRLQTGIDYAKRELKPHTVSNEALRKYRQYQNMICQKYGGDRYLAKNNNLVLRIASLAPRCPDSIFVVIFRNPLRQSLSLLHQHRKFIAVDKFTKNYMTWLAHHEFGVTHRQFRLSRHLTDDPRPDNREYWLRQWVEVYEYLWMQLSSNNNNILAVSYERLCQQPRYWDALCDRLKVSRSQCVFRESNRYEDDATEIDSELLKKVTKLYYDLDRFALSLTGGKT
ncbi:MAG: hypothetical protein ACI8P9_004698 [Parasphingorhabdus sp.]|jgi:hypothetical protein